MFCYIPLQNHQKMIRFFEKRQNNDKKITKKSQKLESFNVLLHSSYKIIKKLYGFLKNDKNMTKKWQTNEKKMTKTRGF